MLRKTLVTLTAIAALSLGSTAMAAHGGGGGGGGGHAAGFGGGGGGFGGGGDGRAGVAAVPGSAGGLRIQGSRTFNRNNFAFDRDHDRFNHRFHHNRNFFAFGFGGPYYDYAYDSCWAQVPTYYGWQWVNVCGDYGYY